MAQRLAKRRLYSDIALSSGLTINAPISPVGLDGVEEAVASIAEMALGPLDVDLAFEECLWLTAGGRMCQNLSNVL